MNIALGDPVLNWQSRPQPTGVVLTGRFCRLEPLHIGHVDALFSAYGRSPDARDWDYLSVGPFPHIDVLHAHVEHMIRQTDPLHFAVIELGSGQALGTLERF